MAKNLEVELDGRLMRAMSHPLRVRMLRILSDRIASPNQLATIVEEPLGTVAYHVRVLVENGCLVLEGTRRRRGAIEHFYRAREGSCPTWLPIRVDEAGRGEVREILAAAERSLRAIGEKNMKRLKDAPGTPVVIALGAFEAKPGA